MKIKCCKDCIAPKRYPGCHSVCPEYIHEKELCEKERNAIRDERMICNRLYEQCYKGVQKAQRHKRR